MPLEPNTTISHYKILSSIGKGGMGEVYLAQDTKLNRKVAIKFLSEEFLSDTDKLNRFIQEAQAASALNHPNIVTIHEIGEWEDSRYIALEYIEGETLTQFLKRKLSFEKALDIARQIASALDAAHTAGIVHRDIKPDNVMIRPDGVVKILDFGIAKLSVPGAAATGPVNNEGETAVQVNTSPGMIIGTANYMSPEQAKGKDIDSRTDIFSLGVVLYEMISGELPFSGDSPLEIIGSILNKEPKPIGNEEVPAELERIVSKSLRKSPDERYQTMKGLGGDLKEVKRQMDFQDQLDKTVQPERAESETQILQATTAAEAQQTTTAEAKNDSISIKRSSFGKVLAALAVILVLSAIGIGYWYFYGSADERIDSIAVMPFVSGDESKDAEYLSDGLAESIIYDLSKIPQLKVLPASTVFRYKGKEMSAEKVAGELGVRAVLVSRLSQKGDELTISTELIDTQQNKVIWGERYARKVNDSLSIQKDISQRITERLRIGLSGEQEKDLARKETTNLEAYQAYLKGRFHWNKRAAGIEKGIEYFKQAIELDPNYALAWSGLADSYILSTSYLNKKEEEEYPKAKAAARKAIELDPELAEAHTSLAYVLVMYDKDYAAAERSFLKAIELDPKYPTARHWYSLFLMSQQFGRLEESLEQARIAAELDPLSMSINGNYADILGKSKRFEESYRQFLKIDEMFPQQDRSYLGTSSALVKLDRHEEALTYCQKIEEKDNNRFRFCQVEVFHDQGEYRKVLSECEMMENAEDGSWVKDWQQLCLAYGHKGLGNKKKVLDIIESKDFDHPMYKAGLYGFLGDKDKAFQILEKLLAEKNPELIQFQYHHIEDLSELRSDPRFDKLMDGIQATFNNKN